MRPAAGSPAVGAGRIRPVPAAAEAVHNHHPAAAGAVRNRHLAEARSRHPAEAVAAGSCRQAGVAEAGAAGSHHPAVAEEAVDHSWFAVPFNDFHGFADSRSGFIQIPTGTVEVATEAQSGGTEHELRER